MRLELFQIPFRDLSSPAGAKAFSVLRLLAARLKPAPYTKTILKSVLVIRPIYNFLIWQQLRR